MGLQKSDNRVVVTWFIICCILCPWEKVTYGVQSPDFKLTGLKRLIQNHRAFCKLEDSCNELLNFQKTFCCEDCSCSPDCIKAGNCCPEVLTNFWTIERAPTLPYTCLPTSYPVYNFSTQREFQQMISSCPNHFGQEDVLKKCEKRYDRSELVSVLPVYDFRKDITYANKYCAECHAVSTENMVYWTVTVRCGSTPFTPTSYDTMLAEINATRDCKIEFSPVKPQHRHSCNPNLLSSCNITGQWATYDNFTEQACSLYSATYKHKYRNPFCALCNGYDINEIIDDMFCQGVTPENFPPFSAILDFRAEEKLMVQRKPDEKCLQDQLYDPIADICRDLLCNFGMVLKDRSCVSIYNRTRGVCYQINVQLQPLKDPTSNGTLQTSEIQPGDVNQNSLEAALAFEKDALNLVEKHQLQYSLKNISYYKSEPVPQDTDFDGIIYVVLFLYLNYEVSDVEFLKEVNDLYNENDIRLEFSGRNKTFRIDLIRMQDLEGFISPLTGRALEPFNFIDVNPYLYDNCVGDVVSVTSFNSYPFVRLDNTTHSWSINASGVHLHELNIFVENAMFRETENKSLILVSAESLGKAVEKSIEKVNGSSSSEAAGLVSFVLVCISSVCLLITLFTYSLFPVLRSQPGVNNMILSTFLIIGYLLFAFGTSHTDLGIGCQIIGGAVHFTWTLVFFWMNVCSFHMFRIFGSVSKPQAAKSNIRLTLVYLLYAVLSTMLVVGINVAVTYYTTDGASYGYGAAKQRMCFIYEPMMILYTMGIPAISIVLVNLVLFIVVAVRIRRTNNVKKHVQNDRNHFSIYIKLSTMTGMAWIFAIPTMIFRSEVLNYIFIVLTCTQGIYFMVAFVCNKRVLKLFVDKCSTKEESKSATAKTDSSECSEQKTGKTKIYYLDSISS